MRSTILISAFLAAAPVLARAAPPTPPSPEVAAAMTTLEKICLPLASGADLKTVAAASGIHLRDGAWVLAVNGPEQVLIEPPDTANPHVCAATLRYRGDQATAIVGALGTWAAGQTPRFAPGEVAAPEKGPQRLRTVSSWLGATPKASDTVMFAEEKTLSGKPVDGDLNEAQLLVSVTPI